MTVSSLRIQNTVQDRHLIGDQIDILRGIQDAECDLCLWRRPNQGAIAREVSTLTSSALPGAKFLTTLASIDADILSLMEHQGLNPYDFINLRRDIYLLAKTFVSIAGRSELVFRLFTTKDRGCSRFHVDRMNKRLICTYQGAGTQWLTESQVDREAQHRYGTNDEIVRFDKPQQLACHWVGIMKGDPNNRGSGLVHRSPSNDGSGVTRVVFCLDG
ncbi:MAG: hypothetical protein ACI9B8_002766 [Sulfitobacter sp.]|jgi:hypothetical protein